MHRLKSPLSTLALTAALSASLALGGCNKKEINAKGEKIETLAISKTVALQALRLMGLETSGASNLVWASRTGKRGNYIFTDIGPKDNDDKGLTVGTLELKNVRMDGDIAVFDQISFNNMKAVNKKDIVSLKNFTLSNPSPALANAFGELFNGNEDAFEDIEGGISFSAIAFTGFEATGKDGELSLASLKAGETDDGMGMFSLNGLKMDVREKKQSVQISLGSIDVKGINVDKYKGILSLALDKDDDNKNAAALKKIMASMNPYAPDFKSFALKDFHVNADGLRVDLDSIVGKTDRRDGKVYMEQIMSPLTITPPMKSKNKDIRKLKESFDTLGYDTLEITMQQYSVLDAKTDSMIVKDSYIALKDGFKLSFDYDMVGYKAYLESALENGDKTEINPMAVLGMMNKLKVNSARIALKDDSIVDRAFKLAAKEQGSTPAALKRQAITGLQIISMMAKDNGQQKLADNLRKSLEIWLDEGGTLVVNMAPAKPVVIGSIAEKSMQGDFDVNTLGITITHEK